MLLRSDISRHLLDTGAHLTIFSANCDEPYFRQEFTHPQIDLRPLPVSMSRLEANMMTLRQFFLMNPSLGATLNHKREAFRAQAPIRSAISRTVNSVLGRSKALRCAYMAAEAKLFPGRELDALFLAAAPDLMVTGTPGFNPADVHLLRCAHRLGVRTATVMLSWDNLSSKGYMNSAPQELLVWSDLMAEEAKDFHEFPPARISWTGAAQFDHYHDIRKRLDREKWRLEHGIANGAPLIVYGTINPALVPHELGIVRQIANGIKENRLGARTHLWVRLHPQVVRGEYSTSLDGYRALQSSRVHIEIPQVMSDSLAWDLPAADAKHLAELLAAADVVATPCSTLIIDAACAGTPVVNVSYDGPDITHQALSARRFLQYTHYAHAIATGGAALANSFEEFVEKSKAYIADPTIDADGRARLIRQQLGEFDGNAGRRTAERLLQLASAKIKSD
jgi:hypothetical protein